MPNGEDLNELLEFEKRIKEMPSEDRSIFIARQTYTLMTKMDGLDKKFDETIEYKKKVSAISGGVSGGIIAGIITLFEFFRR